MPKTKISEFSATPGNNTDIDGINIAEGCAPSGINDAIRELMAQLKDFQAGTAGDSFNGPVGTTTAAAGAFTNLSASGTFALTGDQVQISEGGTGQTTANAAFNALAPSQSTHAGKYLKTDGTNTSWDALDISTADITGTLPVANGGTGVTSSTGTGSVVLSASPTFTGTVNGASLTLSSNFTLSGGTANGVAYLNGSKVLTTGSALVFDGSNLGLGVTPSASAGAKAINIGSIGYVFGDGSIYKYNAGITSNAYVNGNGTFAAIQSRGAGVFEIDDGVFKWRQASSGTAGSTLSLTQAMTLDASGNLLVGTTSSSQGSSDGNKLIGSGAMWVVNNGGNDAFSYFNTSAGAYRFFVSPNGTISATNTTISAISDQRFKENIVDLDVGLDAIMALKPRKFDWKAGKGKDIKGDRGFIAQEFEQVFPDLIDEWKDPAPEGEEPYKSVRQDLIPVLVKAIQEQQAIITDLRARVAALETK